MKITKKKIKEKLEEKGFLIDNYEMILIREIVEIIDTKLKFHKGFSIK